MGFDLLELPLETLDGYDLRRAREALEAEGLVGLLDAGVPARPRPDPPGRRAA